MQEHKFDDVLNYLCSGIMSKSERQSVRDELYDHLMCRYETNIAVGMSEDEAEEKAVEALGNKSALKDKFQKVHWYYPAQSLRTAFYILILSMTLPLISVSLSSGDNMYAVGMIASVISIVVEITALYMLKTANGWFENSFKIGIATSVMSVLQLVSEPFLLQWQEANMWLSFAVLLFSTVKYYLIYKGVKELVKPYDGGKTVSQGFLFYFQTFIFGLSVPSGVNNDVFSVIYYLISVICFFSFVACMLKASDILYRSDHEYKVNISVTKRWLVAISALLIIFAVIFTGNFVYSKTRINKSHNIPYSTEDVKMEQQEYERIFQNISSYGIDENLVSLLPKSEVSKYAGVINKSKLSESARLLWDHYNKTIEDSEVYAFDRNQQSFYDYCMVRNYAVPLGYSDDGEQLVRFIKVFRVPEEMDSKCYKDIVLFDDYLENIDMMLPDFKEEKYGGDLLIALKLEDGKLYQRDLKLVNGRYDSTNELNSPVRGFMFDVEPGVTIIYAATKKIKDIGSTVADVNFTYYHQESLFIFPLRNVEELFEIEAFSDIPSYEIYKYESSLHYYVMPECEYYVPSENIK